MRRFSSSDEDARVSASMVVTTGQIRSTAIKPSPAANSTTSSSSPQLISPPVGVSPATSHHPTGPLSKRCRIVSTPITSSTTHAKESSRPTRKASALRVGGGSATESPLSLRACGAEESVPTTPLQQPPSAWLPVPPAPPPQRSTTTSSLGNGSTPSSSISAVAQEAHAAILSYLHSLSAVNTGIHKPVVDDSIVEVARFEDRYEVCGTVGSGSHSVVYHVQRERRSRGGAVHQEEVPTVSSSTGGGSSSNNISSTTTTSMSSLRRRKVSYAAKVISLLSHTLEEVLMEVNIALKLQFNSGTDLSSLLCTPKVYKIIIAPDGTHITIIMELLKGGELFKEVSNLSPSVSSGADVLVGGGVPSSSLTSTHIPRPATTVMTHQDHRVVVPPSTVGPTPSTSYTVNNTGAGGGRVGQITPPPTTSYLPSVHSSGGSGSGAMFMRSTSSSMGGASSTDGYDSHPLPLRSKSFSNNNNQLLLNNPLGDYSTVVPPPTSVLSQREWLIRHYLWDVLHALSTFHEIGIAHRDIKLENIVQITPSSHQSQQSLTHRGAFNAHRTSHHQPLVKVIDLGFARDISSSPHPMMTPTHSMMGMMMTSSAEPLPLSFEMLPPITPPRQHSSNTTPTGAMMMMGSRSPTPLVLGGGGGAPKSISPSLSPSPIRSTNNRAPRPDRPFMELVGSSQYVAPEALRASRFRSSSASTTPQRGMSPQSKHSPSPQGAGGGGSTMSTPLASPSTTPLPGAFSRQAASGGYGREVDVWAAGVCLYTLLFGKYPFNAQRSSHQHRNIMSGKYSVPTYLANTSSFKTQLLQHPHRDHHSHPAASVAAPSSECLHLLRQMLTIDPDVRISATEALSHPWFALSSSGHLDK